MRATAFALSTVALATAVATAQPATTQPATLPSTQPAQLEIGDAYVVYAQDQFASGAGSTRFWSSASVPLDVEKQAMPGSMVQYTIRPQGAEVIFDDLGAVAASFGDAIEIRLLRDTEAETLEPTIGQTPITAAMRQVVADVRQTERVNEPGETDADGYRFGVDLPLDDILDGLGLDLPTPMARVRVNRVGTSLGRLWLMEFEVAPMSFTTSDGDVVLMRHDGFVLLSEDQETLVSGGTRYRGQVAEASTGGLVPYEGRRLFALAPDPDNPDRLFDATGVAAIRAIVQAYGNPADFAAAAEGDLTDNVDLLTAVPEQEEALASIRTSTIPSWLGEVRDVAVGLDLLGATAAEAQANPLPMMVLASVPAVIDPVLAFGTSAYDDVSDGEDLNWSGGLASLASDAVMVFDDSGNALTTAADIFGAAEDPRLAGPALAAASGIEFSNPAYASFASAALSSRPTEAGQYLSGGYRGTWIGTALGDVAGFLLAGQYLDEDDFRRISGSRSVIAAQQNFNNRQLLFASANPGIGSAGAYASRQNLALTNLINTSPTFLNQQTRLAVANVGVGSMMPTVTSGGFSLGGGSTSGLTDIEIELPLTFRIFDGGAVDGDTVQLSVVDRNGNLVLRDDSVDLPGPPGVTYSPTIDAGRIEIQLLALNQGSVGANTGAIEIESPITSGSSSQSYALSTGETGVLVIEASNP